jgi:N-acetylglutamate synthase-like GNAT family acetyltransferase
MIKIVSPQTHDEFKAYYDLRYKVLREPFGLPRGTEKDDYEPISQHFMAIDEDTKQIVGVIKLMQKEPGVGCFTHMAVADDFQKKGIGKQLLAFIEKTARDEGYKELGCMAHLNTTEYFEHAGYKINGLPTHYLGINQVVWMEKTL